MAAAPEPDGAERLDRFMARANAAYYAGHDPFQDFTTAPEISQMFGEILGVWVVMAWITAGRPAPFRLVEPGPGRGTLMRDMLRTLRHTTPDCAAAAAVHLIEVSPALRRKQAEAVQAQAANGATWHAALDTVPGGPMILVANEFLDALPIRQFVRRGAGWRERHVAAGAWVEQELTDPETLVPPRPDVREGAIVEVNEPARAFVGAVAGRVVRDGGAALFIDYGPAESAAGDSLQAIARRRRADPLTDPGHADLTAHVDFADLAATARAHGAAVGGPVTQGAFLTAWGLFERARRLARLHPDHADAMGRAARRLTDPAAMGTLFKVMAVTQSGWPDLLQNR